MSENSPTTLQAPSRDEIRHRRLARKAKLRRRFFVVPVICVGLAMMGAGAYIMITGGSIGGDPSPATVEGTSVDRTTTIPFVPVDLNSVNSAPSSTEPPEIEAETLVEAGTGPTGPSDTVDLGALETVTPTSTTTSVPAR